jgi:hypothetical protein
VCLVHVKSGQFVVSGVSSEYGDLAPTIGLSISLAGWKLSLYNIVGDGFVKPGDALRFFHEEGGFLARGSVGKFLLSRLAPLPLLVNVVPRQWGSVLVGTW